VMRHLSALVPGSGIFSVVRVLKPSMLFAVAPLERANYGAAAVSALITVFFSGLSAALRAALVERAECHRIA
jgi:hypothetical protein